MNNERIPLSLNKYAVASVALAMQGFDWLRPFQTSALKGLLFYTTTLALPFEWEEPHGQRHLSRRHRFSTVGTVQQPHFVTVDGRR